MGKRATLIKAFMVPLILLFIISIIHPLITVAAAPNLEGLVCSSLDGDNTLFLLRGPSGYVNKLVIVNTTTGSMIELKGFSDTNDYNILAAKTLGGNLYVIVHSLHNNKIYIYVLPDDAGLASLGSQINVLKDNVTIKTIELYLPQGTIESASASIGDYNAIIYSVVLVPEKKGMTREAVITVVDFYGKPTIEKQEIVNIPGELFIPPNSACTPFIAGLSQNTLTLATYSSSMGGTTLSIYATLPQPPDPTSITLLKTKLYITVAYTTFNSSNTFNIIWFSRSSGETEEATVTLPSTTISVKPEEITDLGRGEVLVQAITIKNNTRLYRAFVIIDYNMRKAIIYEDELGVPPDLLLVQKGILEIANNTVSLKPLSQARKVLEKLGGNVSEDLKFEPVVGAVAPANTRSAHLFEIAIHEYTTTTAPTKKSTSKLQENTPEQASMSGTTGRSVEEKRKLVAVVVIVAIVVVTAAAIFMLWRRGFFSRRKASEEQVAGTILDVGI